MTDDELAEMTADVERRRTKLRTDAHALELEALAEGRPDIARKCAIIRAEIDLDRGKAAKA